MALRNVNLLSLTVLGVNKMSGVVAFQLLDKLTAQCQTVVFINRWLIIDLS